MEPPLKIRGKSKYQKRAWSSTEKKRLGTSTKKTTEYQQVKLEGQKYVEQPDDGIVRDTEYQHVRRMSIVDPNLFRRMHELPEPQSPENGPLGTLKRKRLYDTKGGLPNRKKLKRSPNTVRNPNSVCGKQSEGKCLSGDYGNSHDSSNIQPYEVLFNPTIPAGNSIDDCAPFGYDFDWYMPPKPLPAAEAKKLSNEEIKHIGVKYQEKRYPTENPNLPNCGFQTPPNGRQLHRISSGSRSKCNTLIKVKAEHFSSPSKDFKIKHYIPTNIQSTKIEDSNLEQENQKGGSCLVLSPSQRNKEIEIFIRNDEPILSPILAGAPRVSSASFFPNSQYSSNTSKEHIKHPRNWQLSKPRNDEIPPLFKLTNWTEENTSTSIFDVMIVLRALTTILVIIIPHFRFIFGPIQHKLVFLFYLLSWLITPFKHLPLTCFFIQNLLYFFASDDREYHTLIPFAGIQTNISLCGPTELFYAYWSAAFFGKKLMSHFKSNKNDLI